MMSRCCSGPWLPTGMLFVFAVSGMVGAGWWNANGGLVRASVQDSGTSSPRTAASGRQQEKSEKAVKAVKAGEAVEKVLETATFGNGCYWCTEAVFQRVKGVEQVTSGFMGGHVPNPTYEQVCTGRTGHAEVLHLQFDPAQVSYEKLLEIFWSSHDPTTLNRQGNDIGPMYRSAVFYHSDAQKDLATKYKQRLDEARAFNAPIVTEITQASEFYAAPDYHQDYYNRNKSKNPYCKMITYKLQNFRKAFKDVIDKEKDRVK